MKAYPPLITALGLTVVVMTACSGQESRQAGEEQSTLSQAAPDGAGSTAAQTRPDLATWSDPAPTGQAGQPRGLDIDADSVDDTDVDQVADAFARTKLTPDTLIDLTPTDADRRAARWMSEEYAATQTQPRNSTGGANWLALAQNEGYQSVELADTAAVADGLVTTSPQDLNAERPYIATTTAHDAELPQQSFAIVVYLTRTDPDADWSVYDWYQETSYE